MNFYTKIVYALTLVAVGVGAWFGGVSYGAHKGVDMYHQQCYTIGGIIIDESNGTVVKCGPLGNIPKQELPKYKVLDKLLKV